ncbi:MAG TPA: DNA recombination protein RmuC [Candidatus Binatia bacterium]|jgi:DNA recombination protein RmuC|nr:DNA recombination protein RmuC [Candidatus Binatia bacterium]
MDVMLLVGIAVGAGLLLGTLITWLIGRPRTVAVSTQLGESQKRVVQLEGQLTETRRNLDEVAHNRAWLEADLQHERRASAEKLAVVAEAERALRDAFQNLSAEALRQNNASFLELARAQLGEFQTGAQQTLEARHVAIDELLKPVRDSITRMDESLRRVETNHGALSQQVTGLQESEQRLLSQTANLTMALRAPGVRGRWGEVQLRRVVELAGMLEHCDFDEQVTADGDEGRLRPDLIVRLPGGRNIVVDAKAVMRAYVDAEQAPDDATRAALLAEHAKLVRDHMTKLSAKAYQQQFRPSPEFVVMFLPGENFFRAALDQDSTLIDRGVAQRIVLASPINLIALLWGAAQAWREQRVAENAQEVCENGRELYKRIGKLAEHFDTLRKSLSRAVDAYNEAVGSLDRRVLPAARRFKELGAGTSDEIEALLPVDRLPAAVQAPELLPLFDPSRGEGMVPVLPLVPQASADD